MRGTTFVKYRAFMLHNVCPLPRRHGPYDWVQHDLESFEKLCSEHQWGTLEGFVEGRNNLLTFDDGYASIKSSVLSILSSL